MPTRQLDTNRRLPYWRNAIGRIAPAVAKAMAGLLIYPPNPGLDPGEGGRPPAPAARAFDSGGPSLARGFTRSHANVTETISRPASGAGKPRRLIGARRVGTFRGAAG